MLNGIFLKNWEKLFLKNSKRLFWLKNILVVEKNFSKSIFFNFWKRLWKKIAKIFLNKCKKKSILISSNVKFVKKFYFFAIRIDHYLFFFEARLNHYLSFFFIDFVFIFIKMRTGIVTKAGKFSKCENVQRLA